MADSRTTWLQAKAKLGFTLQLVDVFFRVVDKALGEMQGSPRILKYL